MFTFNKKMGKLPGEESRYANELKVDEIDDGSQRLDEATMREKWASQVRDRHDSGHDVLVPTQQKGWESAPRSGDTKKSKLKDEKRAQTLFAQGKVEEAAMLGLPMAMGIMSERFYFGEDGCSTDPEKSTAWAVKAAAAGDRVGQFRLAWAYQYGEGGLAVDFRQATAWFKRAAEQGCEASMNNLGYLFKRGGNGILRDMQEALFWFRQGAEAGDIYAQDNLGACYRDGVGVEPNPTHAREWFLRAADGGNAEAQSALGTMLVTGQGGDEDFAKGFEMWKSSAAAGEESSRENIDALRRLIALQKWRVP